MRRTDLTDEYILTILRGRPDGEMTYVMRNILAGYLGRPGMRKHLKTASVLTRLKRMEHTGLVERCPTVYSVMIRWRIKP